jgi:hypothetical protein
MKQQTYLILAILGVAACAGDPPTRARTAAESPLLASGSGSDGTSGGSSGSGSGSGGTTTTAGPLQNVFVNQPRLVAGDTSSVLVSFTDTVPAGGYALSLRASDPAVQVPSTFAALAGVFVVHPPLSTTPITDARTFTVTVTVLGQSKSASAKLFPRTATLAAPSLFSPGDRSNFDVRRIVTFDWNDQNNAWCYEIQIGSNATFSGTIYADVCTPNSVWVQSAFGPSGSTTYWRVRALDASLNPGPWSQLRTFTIR